MLAEALLYARARLAGQRNPHGHLTELVAIWARQRRQRQAWAEHLTRARSLCLGAAESRPPGSRRTALVLGAGLLLDVPLEQLARLFRRVVLADMAFLPGTVRLARSLGNVELLHADLTGCLDAPGAEVRVPDLSLGLGELDFVYSANLLSQLPLAPLAALRQADPQAGPDELTALAAAMVRAHLEGLQRLPCAACLVTDTLERGWKPGQAAGKQTGKAGGVPEYEVDLLHGVRPQLAADHWIWRIAPRGEEHPDLDVERLVLGAPDVHARPHVHAQTGGSDA